MRLRQLIACGALVLGIGCAARGPSPASVADLNRADQLVRDGCYRCLTQALEIYERLLKLSLRLTGVAERAFETALLIALREKELGIPPAAALTRARGFAQRVLPAADAPATAVLIEIAELTAGETSGLDPEAVRRVPGSLARLKELRPLLNTTQDPSLAVTYLSWMVDCEDRITREALLKGDVAARYRDVPLLRFRLALCPLQQRAMLEQLRPIDPRWIDAAFPEGRLALASQPIKLRTALANFTDAHSAFPSSPAILLALAHAQRMMVRLEAAVASYSGVIALVPGHRDARLGRVISLTYLERRDEAIDEATRMIELGTWLIGDAYYWRAFNRYHLQRLDDAWIDVERASSLQANTSVYTLAGLIAYGRKQLDTAKDRFERALQMDGQNCYAAWYLAVVHVDKNQWPDAAPIFSRSMKCFVNAAALERVAMAETEKAGHEPEDLERLMAEHRKSIAEFTLKSAQSSFNAAQGFGRAVKRDEALAHLQLALEHPDLRDKAEALRKMIETLPQMRIM